MLLTFNISQASSEQAATSSLSAFSIPPEDSRQQVTVDVDLDKAHRVGQYVTGHYFIVSDTAGKITSYSPASAIINGAWANGAAVDHFSQNGQPWDQFLASSSISGIDASKVAYTHADNIAPGANDAMTWEAGDFKCFIIAQRRPGVTSNAFWTTIERYARVYIVPEVPLADEYRPAPYWGGAGQRPRYYRSMIQSGSIRSLTFPSSWPYTAATVIPRVPPDLGFYGHVSNNHRRHRQHDSLYLGAIANYSARITDKSAQYVMQIHNAATSEADRQTLIDGTICKGIDMEGAISHGWNGVPSYFAPTFYRGTGAGQNADYELWIYAAAFLLGSSTMLAAAQSIGSTRSTPGYWVDNSWVGKGTPQVTGGGKTHNTQTFFSEHVGQPLMIPDEFSSEFSTRYGVEAYWTNAWETLAIAMFQNGPGGINGVDAVLRGGALSQANTSAAHVAFLQVIREMKPWPMATNDPTDVWRDLYDLVWPLTGYSQAVYTPPQLPLQVSESSSGDDWMFAGPGNGEIGWDVSGHAVAQNATRADFRYSHDAIQYREKSGVALNSDTGAEALALLAGQTYYAGMRFVNAQGAGPWSAHYKGTTDGVERGKFTTPGTPPSVAPVNIVPPSVHVRAYPSWRETLGAYTPVSGVLAADQIELACGSGIWEASPFSPDTHQTFELVRNGSPTGVFGRNYIRRRSDAGSTLAWRVTTNNGVGSSSVLTTAPVTCPALNLIPATTLFDTELGWDAVIDYEASVEGASLYNASIEFDPTFTQAMGEDEEPLATSPGVLFCDTLGSYPTVHIPPHNPALANKTYLVEIEAIVRGSVERIDVVNGIGTASLIGGPFTSGPFSGETAKLVTINTTFSTGGTPPNLYVRIWNNVATAGGGNLPRLSKIVIKEAS